LPYVVHVIDVLRRVSFLGIRNEDVLCAAVLHDVIEDCEVSKDQIEKVFNIKVANIVEELSRPNHISGYKNKKEYLDLFAKKVSVNALIIKFVDRMTNVENYFVDGKKDYSLKYLNQAFSVINRLINELKKAKNNKLLELVWCEIKSIETKLDVEFCKECQAFTPKDK